MHGRALLLVSSQPSPIYPTTTSTCPPRAVIIPPNLRPPPATASRRPASRAPASCTYTCTPTHPTVLAGQPRAQCGILVTRVLPSDGGARLGRDRERAEPGLAPAVLGCHGVLHGPLGSARAQRGSCMRHVWDRGDRAGGSVRRGHKQRWVHVHIEGKRRRSKHTNSTGRDTTNRPPPSFSPLSRAHTWRSASRRTCM